MANIGLGIGSFINGLTSGVNAARQWDQQDQLQKIRERQLSIMENQDRRAEDKAKIDAENNVQDRKWKQEDRDVAKDERVKNEPINNAQRKSILTGLNDASAERDVKAAAGAAAQKEMDANPGKYGSFEDAYRAVAVPKIQQHYLSRGETDKANAFGTWSNHKATEAGIKTFGKYVNATMAGDWEGATRHLQSLFDDPAYLAPTGYKVNVKPTYDESGKVIGSRVEYTGPSGNKNVKDFSNIGDMFSASAPIINPHAAYDWGATARANELSAKAERQKERDKLSDQKELEGFKQQGQMDLKDKEIAGKILENESKGDTKALDQKILIWKNLNENGDFSKVVDGKSVRITPEEQAALVRHNYATLGGRPQADATPNVRSIAPVVNRMPQVSPSRQLPAFAQAQQPAQFGGGAQPPAKAPAAAQQAQSLTVEQQYAQKYGAPLYYTPDEVDMWRRQRGI